VWHQAAEFCPKARLRKVVRFRLDPFEYVDYLDLSILKWKIVEGDGRWWEDGDFDASLRDIGRNESGKVTCFQDILQWLQEFLQAKKPQCNSDSISLHFPTFQLSFLHTYISLYISICWYHIVCYLHTYIYIPICDQSRSKVSLFFGMRLTSRCLRFDVGRIWRHLHWWHLWISLWRWNIWWFRWLWHLDMALKMGKLQHKAHHNRDIAGICWDTLGIHNGYNWIYSQQFSDHKIMANMMIKCQTWNLEVPYL